MLHSSTFVRCLVVTLLMALVAESHSLAEGEPVRAGTSSGQSLTAPVEVESFDFVIFGDHKGGPVESIEVLKDAVAMTNSVDPDFVMTVGDMIGGYNEAEQWLEQMEEFKSVMSRLAMKWFPVAGNHDVYARPKKPGGNTDLYKEHFGPLYYSFDYKWAHFIVLFSDESQAFGNPAKNQNFSEEQLAWLKQDLESSDAKQVFVFLHHPRWTDRYDGCNWDAAHQLFVDDGRDTTVFAGHVHVCRYDGKIDNVEYFVLATTGGHQPPVHDSAALHHVDFVRVRPDQVTVAVVPVGAVYPGDFVLGAEVDAMRVLIEGNWLEIDGGALVDPSKKSSSTIGLVFTNTTDRPMHLSFVVDASDAWITEYDRSGHSLAAGESIKVPVKLRSPQILAGMPEISVRATVYYMLASGLVQPIKITRNLPLSVTGVDSLTGVSAENNGVLALDGKSAVRVEVPEKLDTCTLECWVSGQTPAGREALVAKTQDSAYGIFWSDLASGLSRPTGFVGTESGYVSLQAIDDWSWTKWTHLALVFDGKEAAFYVDGKLQKKEPMSARATHNRFPLFIGADPDDNGKATSFFTGQIDELRLSSVARYKEPFTPAKTFSRDDDTVVLFHFDQRVGSIWLDDSGKEHHGWSVGKPTIKHVER